MLHLSAGYTSENISGYVASVIFADIRHYDFPCFIALNCDSYCTRANQYVYHGSFDNRICEFAERCYIQDLLVSLYVVNNTTKKCKEVVRIEIYNEKTTFNCYD